MQPSGALTLLPLLPTRLKQRGKPAGHRRSRFATCFSPTTTAQGP